MIKINPDIQIGNSGKKLNDLLPKEYVLYNSNGSNGEIILNDNSTKFKYFEIFYKSNDDIYSSVKVYEPYNKKVEFNTHHSLGGTMYAKHKVMKIQNFNMVNVEYSEYWYRNGTNMALDISRNDIYITRVVGYI